MFRNYLNCTIAKFGLELQISKLEHFCFCKIFMSKGNVKVSVKSKGIMTLSIIWYVCQLL